ncbi:hypothetical protein TL16_g10369 [Triparma laevis f. inornata]|uniref:Uncharacterized protein n=1 Tax=Triparma laevis f. inornata TaxID=1714386 RepID=A0A9W7B844_9STRA|nr:hypothetical protein TL16_g10369 [Triparma laevis f. inornata]
MSSLLNLVSLRSDYREPSQSRVISSTILPPPSSISTNSPTGSLTYSQGLTKVQCEIYGPTLDPADRHPVTQKSGTSTSNNKRSRSGGTVGGKGGMSGKKVTLIDLNLEEELSSGVDSYMVVVFDDDGCLMCKMENRVEVGRFRGMVGVAEGGCREVRGEVEGIMRDWARGLFERREGDGRGLQLLKGRVVGK